MRRNTSKRLPRSTTGNDAVAQRVLGRMAGDGPFVGRSVLRLEDRPLVLGQGRFAADVSFAHQLHMRVVRSTHAHGRIVAIDSAKARAAPGVIALWTAADVADIPPIDFRLTRIEGLEPCRQPILAKDHVRYVGEPLAVVFAADLYPPKTPLI